MLRCSLEIHANSLAEAVFQVYILAYECLFANRWTKATAGATPTLVNTIKTREFVKRSQGRYSDLFASLDGRIQSHDMCRK